MNSYRVLGVIFLWLAGHALYCQDIAYAREVISHLCDQSMYGRGFVRDGDHKAAYYIRHPQRFSVVFIGFTGEEAGLLGSGFFADHPLVSLSNVKFLVNLDLVGTGIDGITVVNATEYPDQFEMLSHLNDTGLYLVNIKKRGTACNSDHCPFYTKGVPCFFIYTLGGIAAYHNLDDRPETLPLTAFEALSKLLIAFGEKQ